MGFFRNLLSPKDTQEQRFIDLIRAREAGEKWAQDEIQRLWESNDKTLLPRIGRAWVVIYKDAAYAGNREAILKYARGLEDCNREAEALQWYMKLIEQGDTGAMLALAQDYTKYGGMGENCEEYFKWVFSAAQAGDAEAQEQLAMEYRIQRDRENARQWYEKSATQGNINGMIGLAGEYIDQFYDLNHERIKRHENPDFQDDEIEIKNELLFTAEDWLMKAFEKDICINEAQKIFEGLGDIYSHLSPALYRRAAFYYYKSYLCETEMDSLLKRIDYLNKDHNLGITQQLLDYWSENPYDEENE